MSAPADVAMRSIGALCLAAALAAGGCGGSAPSAPTAATVPAANAATAANTATAAQVAAVEPPGAPKPAALPKEPPAGPPLAPLNYDAKGRRDPFVSITKDIVKGGLSVTSLKLAGVIRGRTLLALVEAPDGLGYILKPGDSLGDGRVTDITQNSVTFTVAPKPGQAPTTATLRLAQE